MIDIEATGIDHAKEDLLSIGLLEADWDGKRWLAGASKEWFVHTDREPESQFAKEQMAELYAKCRAAPVLTTERLRWEVLEFLRSHGTTGATDTYFMGWNASNFDLPFLVAKGILVPSSYATVDGKDQQVGDYHYRVYEMGGAISLAQNVKEEEREKLIERAREALPVLDSPAGKKHDALHDCYTQLHLLNGLIQICRRSY